MADPSTPPNSQSISFIATLSDTTPLRRDIPGSAAHTTAPRKNASERYKDVTFDMCEHFVGPMPVEIFLKEFIPEAPTTRPQGGFTFSKTTVSRNENEFINAVRASGLCPHLHFVNTTSRSCTKYPDILKPDISVFSRVPGPESQQQNSPDWGLVELWIENKPSMYDPFMKIEELHKDKEDVRSHIDWTDRGYKACGQLISYATAVHRCQFRLFSFSIALFGENARLLRWDRSGVVYTPLFPWTDGNFFEFLWRFNHLSAIDRGHDVTVSVADDGEAELAFEKLKTRPIFANLEKGQLHQILVWDDCAPTGEPRRYITPSARWATDALVGRATYGYIAYDVENGNLVYLKDFWRVDHPDIQKEGDVYRELHEARVRNIAEMDFAGDVPLMSHHDGKLRVDARAFQRTRTQDFVSREWCPGKPHVEPYVHYRLVLKTLGTSLNQYKSTRQLCEVIRDAIVAHTDAYDKTRILHRDVSAGNILITDEGGGILIDWDLSKKVREDSNAKPRQYSRTGTWQFISVARLLDPWSTPHQISDDLESFFWVLLYQIVRGRDEKKDFQQVMVDVFDQYEPAKGNHSRGGRGKLSVLKGGELTTENIMSLTFGTPCFAIVDELRELFNDFYRFVNYHKGREPKVLEILAKNRAADARVQEARRKLQSSDAFLAILKRYLDSNWDVNDDRSLDPSDPLRDHSASRNRKRRFSDIDDGSNLHLNRRGRMPPKSIERSRDVVQNPSSLSSGGLTSTSLSRFSARSRMDFSRGSPFSESPRLSDENSSAKR